MPDSSVVPGEVLQSEKKQVLSTRYAEVSRRLCFKKEDRGGPVLI